MAIDPIVPVMEREDYEGWTDLNLATERERRGAFKVTWLPEPSGKKALYAIGLKPSCPRKAITIFGITFEKEVFSPITEIGQLPEPVQVVVELAENQIEAIKKRAEVLEIDYLDVVQKPHPLNPAFQVTEAGEWKKFKASEYITIRKLPLKKWDKNTISMYELQDLMAAEMMTGADKSEKTDKKGK
ncbi:MAG: hypothetical protein D6785_07800 [Planctomycetota bacterium]|nr:MAG: hypothetical protein D6785_07800 [Planctomycetota bacterium]